MKHKKNLRNVIGAGIPLFALLCIHAVVSAQSFEAGGIIYNILLPTGNTVEVAPKWDNPYSGAITIPHTVEYDGSSYTVTALGESAFEGCTGVTSLMLPATIRSIGSYCFYNCDFTTLQLPDSLRTLGDHAFLYSRISSLHLPACFEEYGDCAFWARNLASITVDGDNPRYRSIGGWLYSKDSLTLCIVPDGVTGTINVPSYVRHIGRMAFGFNSNITAVSLPEGLVSIGAFAFNCCPAVDNIVIPSTVASIGVCSFSYCPGLDNLSIAPGNSHYVLDGLMLYSSNYDTLFSCHKSGATVSLDPHLKVLGGFENNTWVRNITVPAGVTDITENCFNGCSFSSIALPARMKSIGPRAFSENYSLASVTMPQTLLSMGEGAFAWCIALTSIRIPDSLRVIPKEAFNSCPRLASVTWGNAVGEIGQYAFWAMAATRLDLPPTLRKLGDYAFAACSNRLAAVTVQGQIDTMGTAVFGGSNLNNLRFATGVPPAITGVGPLFDIGSLDTILVPCGSLGAWLADSYWGQFADKYSEDCNGIRHIAPGNIKVYSLDGRIVVEGADGETVRIYDMVGRPVANSVLPTGVYMVKIGDRPARKVAVIQ